MSLAGRAVRCCAAVLVPLLLLAAAPAAHHGAADYVTNREVIVSGVVREWRFTNPHTWIVIDVRQADGRIDQWDGEGPPLSWATGRGWSATTLRQGETVSLVMYPSRRNARSGLVKRIERTQGETLLVSRPWLDR